MNYQVYDEGAYKLHCIRSNNFKKTNIIINFKRKADKKELSLRALLPRTLMESTQKYKTAREMIIETENLYNLYLNTNCYLSGNYNIIRFDATFLNNDYTEENLFEKAVDFILEIITNPNIKNNAFDEKTFSITKDILKEEIETFNDDPNRYSFLRLYKEIDRKSIYASCILGTLKELEKITPKKLYNYYKSVIESDQIDIFVISPLDKETVRDTITKKLNLKNRKAFTESHYIDYTKYHKKPKVVKETSEYEQSKLLIACKFDTLTDFEMKYVSLVYSYILGGSPSSKLFQTVREKNSLCYSISSSFKPLNKFLIISSGINPDSFKRAYRLIKKEIKNMEKGNFEKNKIEEAKVTYRAGLEEIKDSPSALLNTYIAHEYINTDLLDERYSKIGDVTYEDVVEFAKKVHIDTVYLLEGAEEDAKK